MEKGFPFWRHENVFGEKRYSSTHSFLQHEMETSGQLKAPASLISAKKLSNNEIAGSVRPTAKLTNGRRK